MNPRSFSSLSQRGLANAKFRSSAKVCVVWGTLDTIGEVFQVVVERTHVSPNLTVRARGQSTTRRGVEWTLFTCSNTSITTDRGR